MGKKIIITNKQLNRLNEHLNMNIGVVSDNEVRDFIRYVYGETNDVGCFKKHDVNPQLLIDELINKNILIKKLNNKIGVSKNIGSNPMKKIKTYISSWLNKHSDNTKTIDEADWFDNMPGHPANQQSPKFVSPEKVKNVGYELIYYNNEIAILKNGDNKYVFDYGNRDKDDFKPYANLEIIDVFDDGEGGVDYEYSKNFEIDGEVLENFVNDNINDLTVSIGADDFESGNFDLVKIDDSLKMFLLDYYDKDNKLVNILNTIEETTTGGAFGVPGNQPVSKMVVDNDINEITTTGGVGQYDAPAFSVKKDRVSFKKITPKSFKTPQIDGGKFVK